MDKITVVIYFFCVAYHDTRFSRYLPVNSEALRWEIYCNDAGYAHVPPGVDYPLVPEDHPREYAETVVTGRVLNEFQVVYITAGGGSFEAEGVGRRRVSAGDMFMLFPGVRHAYRPFRETGWYEYWVGFAGEHAHRLRRHGLFSPVNAIHTVGINREIIADYEQIVRLCRRQTPGFQVLLGALVLQLLAHIHAIESQSGTGAGDSELVSSSRAVMQQHLDEGIEIEDIAARIGVSYTRLLSIFRKYTGLTPYQYFLQLRIRRAKELLQIPGVSIKEVAARMNFENQYYFSRLFRRKTGVTPSQWRAGHTGGAGA